MGGSMPRIKFRQWSCRMYLLPINAYVPYTSIVKNTDVAHCNNFKLHVVFLMQAERGFRMGLEAGDVGILEGAQGRTCRMEEI